MSESPAALTKYLKPAICEKLLGRGLNKIRQAIVELVVTFRIPKIIE